METGYAISSSLISTYLFYIAVDLVTSLITLFEDHYPERLKKVYVINGEHPTCHTASNSRLKDLFSTGIFPTRLLHDQALLGK